MAELTYQADHEGDALDKLIEQYRDKPRVRAIVIALMRHIQRLEDVTFDLYLGRWIETGRGAVLDLIGRIIDEARQGIEDEAYRGFLRAKVRALRSTALLSELVKIAALIQGDSLPVRAKEFYPAAVELEPREEVIQNPIRVGRMLKKATAGGVALRFVYLTAPRANTLMLDNDMDSGDLTPDQCFGDGQNDPITDGGLMAGVYG